MKVPCLSCLGVILASAGPLSAALLLEIDVSNPAAVVVRATGGAPSENYDMIDNYLGISLTEFILGASFESGIITGSTLSANGSGDPYNEWWFSDFGSGADSLNLYFGNEPARTSQEFLVSFPAFTGTAALNMQNVVLPAIGHSGNVVVGDGDVSGPVIGTYSVVPEPASGALLLLAGGLLLTRRRHLDAAEKSR